MADDRYYILEGREIKPVPDVRTWGAFFNNNEARTVGRDVLDGEVTISTVFLGINHNWGDGPPVLFETMIFGGEHDEAQWRYHTYDEAEAGHQRIVEALKEGRKPEP